MASFFEKLKKGMGAEGAPIEKAEEELKGEIPDFAKAPADKEEKPVEKPKKSKGKKEPKSEKKTSKVEITEQETEVQDSAEEKIKEPNMIHSSSHNGQKAQNNNKNQEKDWSQFAQSGEGQLAIDVYQTETFLVIQSAIAGVKPDSLDVVIEGDMVSIKGVREKPEETAERNYSHQECFWGPFSRQIILSVEVDPSRTEATLKDGILTVRVPKIERERKRKIEVKG